MTTTRTSAFDLNVATAAVVRALPVSVVVVVVLSAEVLLLTPPGVG